MKKILLPLLALIILGFSITNAQYTKTFTGTTVDTSFAKQYLDAPGQFVPSLLEVTGPWAYSQANNELYLSSDGNDEWTYPCFVLPDCLAMVAGDSIKIVARVDNISDQDSVMITLLGLNDTMSSGINLSANFLLLRSNQSWQTLKLAYVGELCKIGFGENIGWYSGPHATPPWWTFPNSPFDGIIDIQSVTVEQTFHSKIITANISPSQSTICSGSSTTLTASGTGGSGGYAYSWNNNLSTSSILTVNPSITTIYTVTINDTTGNSDFAIATVIVYQPNVVGTGDNICLGASTTLYASGANTYFWSNGLGSGDLKIVNPTISTTYTVTGTDANNCSNTADVMITVYSIPPTPTIMQIENNLVSSSIDGNQWYYYPFSIPNANNQSYTPKQNGNYFVIVTQNGCISDTSNLFYVKNVGITEISNNKSDINIFPNPANNKITIDCSTLQNSNLSINNIVGENILQRQLSNGKNEIDVSSLSKGIYIIKIESSQEIMQQKLIKE